MFRQQMYLALAVLLFCVRVVSAASAETSSTAKTADRDDFDAATGARKSEYIRGCYFTNWAQYRQGRAKYSPEDYISGLCTHIFYAFGYINDDYTIRAFDLTDLPTDWAGIGLYARVNSLKKVDQRLKTILSFGGWSFGTRVFKEVSSNPQSRSVFVDSVINFVRRYGFDGIDIDWEYPNGPTDASSFTLLMKDLWEAVNLESKESGRERLILAAAVSASKEKIDAGYEIAKFAPYVDFILLMSYDFHGAWEPFTGLNSPLYSPVNGIQWDLDHAAAYWVNGGMPREKIIIGIATYGRGWTLNDVSLTDVGAPGRISKITNYIGESGVAAYFEICEWLADKAVRRWDWLGKVPYLIYGDQWYSYDDVDSVRAKVEWMKKQRYGGMFVWTLDFDDFNGNCTDGSGVKFPITSTIAKMLKGLVPPQDDYTSTHPLSSTTALSPLMSTSSSEMNEFDEFCSERPDGHHKHPSSCIKFVLCVNSSSFVFNCPQNLLFDPKLRHCAFPINGDPEEQCRISDSETDLLLSSSASKWIGIATTALDLVLFVVFQRLMF